MTHTCSSSAQSWDVGPGRDGPSRRDAWLSIVCQGRDGLYGVERQSQIPSAPTLCPLPSAFSHLGWKAAVAQGHGLRSTLLSTAPGCQGKAVPPSSAVTVREALAPAGKSSHGCQYLPVVLHGSGRKEPVLLHLLPPTFPAHLV